MEEINTTTTMASKKPNVFLAILSAVGLGLVGAVVYGVLYYLGYVAWIGAFLTIVLAAVGYKLVYKKMDAKGYVIIAVIAIAEVLLSMFLALAIYVGKEFGLSLGEAFDQLINLV